MASHKGAKYPQKPFTKILTNNATAIEGKDAKYVPNTNIPTNISTNTETAIKGAETGVKYLPSGVSVVVTSQVHC